MARKSRIELDINNMQIICTCFEIRNLYIDNDENEKNTSYILENLKHHEDIISMYAYILHNQDFYSKDTFDEHLRLIANKGSKKKDHYHCYVRLDKPMEISKISSTLGIPINQIKRFEPKHFDNKLLYLTHICHADKTQYDISQIYTNNRDYLEYVYNNYNSADVTDILTFTINYLEDNYKYCYFKYYIREILKHYESKIVKQYYYIIRDLIKEHNDSIRDNFITTKDYLSVQDRHNETKVYEDIYNKAKQHFVDKENKEFETIDKLTDNFGGTTIEKDNKRYFIAHLPLKNKKGKK